MAHYSHVNGALRNTRGDVTYQLTGTISATAASPNIVGVGTFFTTELKAALANRLLYFNGEAAYVLSVTDDTHLTLQTNAINNAVNVDYFTDGIVFQIEDAAGNPLLMSVQEGLWIFRSMVCGIGWENNANWRHLFTAGDGNGILLIVDNGDSGIVADHRVALVNTASGGEVQVRNAAGATHCDIAPGGTTFGAPTGAAMMDGGRVLFLAVMERVNVAVRLPVARLILLPRRVALQDSVRRVIAARSFAV